MLHIVIHTNVSEWHIVACTDREIPPEELIPGVCVYAFEFVHVWSQKTSKTMAEKNGNNLFCTQYSPEMYFGHDAKFLLYSAPNNN